MTKEIDLRKIGWREASTGGFYLGLALALIGGLGYLLRNMPSLAWLPGLLNFGVLAGFIYVYAKRMSQYEPNKEFTYGQSLGFIFRMMLFAGVLVGLGQFVLQNYVDPEFYRTVFEEAFEQAKINAAEADRMLNETQALQNPILMVFSGIFSMLIYGGLIGLIVSALLRRTEGQWLSSDDSHQPTNEQDSVSETESRDGNS